MRTSIGALFMTVALGGCTRPLEVTGAPCPCPTRGYHCDSTTQRCVRGEVSPSATADAGPPDAQPPPDPEATVCVQPGPSPPRPLGAEEYANTVMDLLGVAVDTTGLPDPDRLPDSQPPPGPDPAELAQAFARAAGDAALAATARLGALLPCQPEPVGVNACARQFAAGFAARAYRRPLLDGELDELVAVFDEARAQGAGFGYPSIIQYVLASPRFYLRQEVGSGRGPRPGLVSLTPYEVATRLSYFLWATTPDETLWNRAAQGRLRSKADVREEAERLLNSARAEAVIAAFERRWLRLERVLTAKKDADTPAFSPALREALVASGQRTVSRLWWSDGGDQAALFGGPMMGNRAMSDFYALSRPAAAEFEPLVPLGDQKRFGVLTLPAVLSALAYEGQSDPIHRGRFVSEQFLCLELPLPPAIIPAPPPPSTTLTTRARFQALTDNPGCRACHLLFDPIGYGLENYDGYGRWRTTENGQVIDASGMTDLNGHAFEGPAGLADLLAKSDAVAACLASQWFRFAVGRATVTTDQCTLEQLEKAFVQGGRRLRPLLLAIATSDAFLTRKAP